MSLSNDIWDRSRFCRGSNSENSETGPISWTEYNIVMQFAYTLVYWQDEAHEIVNWHLGLVEVLPIFKFWKKVEINY